MDYYHKRITFFRRAGVMLACLMLYDLFRLQFTHLNDQQTIDFVQKGIVMTIVFGITNIWHDYLTFCLNQKKQEDS